MHLLVVALIFSILVKGDPCTVIAEQKWAAPKDVRACFTSFKVNNTIKDNVSIHTSYQ